MCTQGWVSGASGSWGEVQEGSWRRRGQGKGGGVGGRVIRESSAGGVFGQTQGGFPHPGRGNPGWWGRDGVCAAMFVFLTWVGSPRVFSADSEVRGQWHSLGLALILNAALAFTSLIPSPRSSAVASWEEVG